jgi:hypothetical protein
MAARGEAGPVVIALVHAHGPLSRGHLLESFYGRPEIVDSLPQFEAWVCRENRGLFSDPEWRGVQALWCVAASGSVESSAFENPWFEGEHSGAFPGRRLRCIATDGTAAHLAWSEAAP